MSNADRRARKQTNKRMAQEERYSQWRSVRRRRTVTTILVILLATALVGGGAFALFGGDDGDDTAAPDECSTDTPEAAGEEKEQFEKPPKMQIDESKKYRATIETSCGTMVAELDPEEDPKTVNNFVFLAEEGFYDGLTFHRVIDTFMIQGGDPAGDGSGGPGYDFTGGKPETPYEIGDLVMANSGSVSTNGSQFFVVTGEQGTGLPQEYSRFGHVTEGVEVAQKMASLQDPARTSPDGAQAPPTQTLYIVKVTVEEVGG